MGSFANTLFTFLLGWIQGIVSAVWSAFTTEKGQNWFAWIGSHWILIAGILCVIGLAADLCVYLFRWQPFRVWKSFFSGNRHMPEEAEEPEQKSADSAENRTDRSAETVTRPIRDPISVAYPADEPDLSPWESGPEEKLYQPAAAAEVPVMTTKAGYTVPADSPYRRPERKSPLLPDTAEQETEPDPEPAYTEKSGPVMLKSRKRRRISVNELFSNPEEELMEFDAPQSVIDRKRAYLDPVYPRGWKNPENSEDEKP